MVKKSYNFEEYIDNGVTKSNTIFEGDQDVRKKGKRNKIIITIIILSIFILASLSGAENGLKITKAEYGDKWAFIYDEAVLKCYKDDDIKSPVIELKGIPYGLTGFADNKYGQSDLNALKKYWIENAQPFKIGTYISVGVFSDDALKLCK
jgi:hypothetical protein